MNTRKMPCQVCTINGSAVFEGDRYAGWSCRNCGHRVSGSKTEMLEILRHYSDSPETTALQAVILMDAEIKRLRAAATPQQTTLPASEAVARDPMSRPYTLPEPSEVFTQRTGHPMFLAAQVYQAFADGRRYGQNDTAFTRAQPQADAAES